MLRRQQEPSRVEREVERVLLEAVEGFVHWLRRFALSVTEGPPAGVSLRIPPGIRPTEALAGHNRVAFLACSYNSSGL